MSTRALALLFLCACGDTALDGDTPPPGSGVVEDDDDTVPPTEAGSWSLVDRLGCGQLASASIIHVYSTAGYDYRLLEASDQVVSCEQWSEFYTEFDARSVAVNLIHKDPKATVQDFCHELKDFLEFTADRVEALVPSGSCIFNMYFYGVPDGELSNENSGAVVLRSEANGWAMQAQALGDCTTFTEIDEVYGAIAGVESYMITEGLMSEYTINEPATMTATPSERGILLEGSDWPMTDSVSNLRLTFSADATLCEAGSPDTE